jgi:PTS system nitrogen regulatory IIA component
MHLGATIRLLRVDAGLSLRDLAHRIGVSSAYLSRVEHGHDAVPTTDRLEAIALALGVPPNLLVGAAHKVGPALEGYVEQVPSAGMLFLEIARRRLGPAEIGRLRAFIEREFPPGEHRESRPSLVRQLSTDRVILRLSCPGIEDALEIASGRLARPREGLTARRVAEEILRRERAASTAVGSGVMVPHALFPGAEPAAALVTLAKPMEAQAHDGTPVRLLVVLLGGAHDRAHMALLAHVARLSSHGLAEELARVKSAAEALERVATIEESG